MGLEGDGVRAFLLHPLLAKLVVGLLLACRRIIIGHGFDGRDAIASKGNRNFRMFVQHRCPIRSQASVWRVVLALAAGIGVVRDAGAQPRGTFLRSGADNKAQHLLGPTGRSCVSIKTNVRPDLVMSGSFQHLVEAKNSCIRPVVVTICYKGSSSGCRDLRLRPNAPGETTMLGVMAGVPRFDVEYSDRFSP